MRIAVVGGTGFTGSAIVAVAAERGHDVVAIARSFPSDAADSASGTVPDGVAHLALDVTAPGAAESVVDAGGARVDAIVSALSPRGSMAGAVAPADARLARAAQAAGVRLVVVGGFGSMRTSFDGPRVCETPGFPAAVRPESLEMLRVLELLASGPVDLDWLYVSPTAGYGPHGVQPARGRRTLGGDVVAPAMQEISVRDLALAVVEEIEEPTRAGHVSVHA